MTDGLRSECNGFEIAKHYTNTQNMPYTHSLGIVGAWFVGRSRDYITKYENNEIFGYEISNCCGNFIIGILI